MIFMVMPMPGESGPSAARQQADSLETFRAALADDLALADLHQTAVEFGRAADHFGVGGHCGSDFPAGVGARFGKFVRVAQPGKGQSAL